MGNQPTSFNLINALLVTDDEEYFAGIVRILENNPQRRCKVTRIGADEFAQQAVSLDEVDILLIATARRIEDALAKLPQRRPVLVLTSEAGFEVSHEVVAWLCGGRFMILPANTQDPGTIVKAVHTLCRATLRIMLVEDDEDDQLTLRDMLATCPIYNVDMTWVQNPLKIRESLARQSYDLLILDYQLGPGESGLAWIQKLHTEGCDTPMLLLSGQSSISLDVLTGNALARGRAMFLSKRDLSTESLTRAIITSRSRMRKKR